MLFQAWVKTVWTAKGKRTGAEFLQEGLETDTIMIILPSYLFPINFQRRHTSWVAQYSVFYGISLVAQMVKNLPEVQKTQVPCLGEEDPLEKGMACHSSILTWRVPQTEEPGGLQSFRSQRVNSLYSFSVSTIASVDDNCPTLLNISVTTKVAHLPEHRS